MQRAGVTYRMAWILGLVVLAGGGCSWIMGPEPALDGDTIAVRIDAGIVFLRMRITPDAHMDALFEGRVVADDQGCLRLDSVDRHTVVWPAGYDFTAADGAVRILDADGSPVGVVGDAFRFGGGEVTSLHDGLGFTRADRELAEAHCPGRYWIVAGE